MLPCHDIWSAAACESEAFCYGLQQVFTMDPVTPYQGCKEHCARLSWLLSTVHAGRAGESGEGAAEE